MSPDPNHERTTGHIPPMHPLPARVRSVRRARAGGTSRDATRAPCAETTSSSISIRTMSPITRSPARSRTRGRGGRRRLSFGSRARFGSRADARSDARARGGDRGRDGRRGRRGMRARRRRRGGVDEGRGVGAGSSRARARARRRLREDARGERIEEKDVGDDANVVVVGEERG